MTPEVAAFLLGLVNQQQVAVGAPDFSEAVEIIQAALTQLGAIVEHADA